jgi:hypothetical protein
MELDSPYSPPTEIGSKHSPAELERKRKFWKVASCISLGLFLVSVFFIVLLSIGTILKMNEMGRNVEGGLGVSYLGQIVGIVIVQALISLIIAIPGLVASVISLIRLRYYRAMIRQLPE